MPVSKESEEEKQTNEIKVAIPLLDPLDIENKNITADALHTQTIFADYIVGKRNGHYFFIVKKNQPTLLSDIEYYFSDKNTQPAQAVDLTPGDHGRIETRKIWTTIELNEYLKFPHVSQVFKIEREFIEKKTGKISEETVYGITSRPTEEADPKKVLEIVRGHWSIENSCHYILDWNYDEDRCRIRTGYGPENVTRLRRFAIGVIKSKAVYSVAQKMRELNRNTRAVFDYLRMAKNSQTTCAEPRGK